MSSSPMIRWNGLAALLAAGMYIAQTLAGLAQLQVMAPAALPNNTLEAIFLSALLLALVGLVGLHMRQRGRAGGLEPIGFYMAFVGTALVLVSAVATLAAGQTMLGSLFVFGLVASLIGVILFGGSILRARVPLDWPGVALVIGVLVALLFANYECGIVLGLAWAGLGYALWMERTAQVARSF